MLLFPFTRHFDVGNPYNILQDDSWLCLSYQFKLFMLQFVLLILNKYSVQSYPCFSFFYVPLQPYNFAVSFDLHILHCR